MAQPIRHLLHQTRREALIAALEKHDCNISRAAEDLSITRAAAHLWLQRYGLTIERIVRTADGEEVHSHA